MKSRRPFVVVVLALAIVANLVAIAVGANGVLRTGQWTPTLAINILILLALVPFLVMELMKPKG